MDSPPEKSGPLLKKSPSEKDGPPNKNVSLELQMEATKNKTSFEYPTTIDFYKKLKFDALSNTNIWAYGVGHFQNDITATTLLNYMPLFLKTIYPIDSENPGYYLGLCLLIGQIVDGIMTPLVGAFSDRIHTSIGKRKPWYIFTFFLVFIFKKAYSWNNSYIFMLPIHF